MAGMTKEERAVAEAVRGIVSRRQVGYTVRLEMAMVAGSAMYSLAGTRSDTDYVGVFTMPSEAYLGLEKASSVMDSIANVPGHGSEAEEDHALHEIGKFARMLAKGNFQAVEQLYSSVEGKTPVVASPAWAALADRRSEFVTAEFVTMYLLYVRTQLRRHGKRAAERSEPKKWYNIFRALYVIGAVVDGRPPPIALDASHPDDSRAIDRLLAIKRGEIDQVLLFMEAKDRHATLVAADLSHLPQSCDREWLNSWILAVRRGDYLDPDVPELFVIEPSTAADPYADLTAADEPSNAE